MADNNGWHVADKGQSIGPMSLDELINRLPQYGGNAALVYGPGLSAWTPAAQVEAVRAHLRAAGAGGPIGMPPVPPSPGYGAGYGGRPRAHDIEYQISANEMQYVEI